MLSIEFSVFFCCFSFLLFLLSSVFVSVKFSVCLLYTFQLWCGSKRRNALLRSSRKYFPLFSCFR